MLFGNCGCSVRKLCVSVTLQMISVIVLSANPKLFLVNSSDLRCAWYIDLENGQDGIYNYLLDQNADF